MTAHPALAQSREIYLNNGPDQAGQNWTSSATIWSEDDDPASPATETLGDDSDDIGVLPDRDLPGGQANVTAQGDLVLGGLRVAGDGYRLIAHGSGALLQGFAEAGGPSVLRFQMENDAVLRVQSIRLGGLVDIEGPGTLRYSGNSAADMTGLQVAAGSIFLSEGVTAGAVSNDGTITLQDHQGAIENRGDLTIAQNGVVQGPVVNRGNGTTLLQNATINGNAANSDPDSTLEGRGRITGSLQNSGILRHGSTGGQLQLGALDNLGTGQIQLQDNARLVIDDEAVNAGRITVEEDARITLGTNVMTNIGQLDLAGTIQSPNVTQLFNGVSADGTHGEITLSGGQVQGVLHNSTALSQITGTGRIAARLNNYGRVEVTGDGLSGSALDVNRLVNFAPGRITVRNGYELIAQQQITNRGQMNIEGDMRLVANTPLENHQVLTIANTGTIHADIDNRGTGLSSQGRILGRLTNQTGARAQISGQITGQVVNDGEIGVTGNLQAAQGVENRQNALLNVLSGPDRLTIGAGERLRNAGTVNLGGTIAGRVTNSRDLNLQSGRIQGQLDNEGAARLRGTGEVTGALINDGRIEVGANGGAGNQLGLGGALNNRAAGEVVIETGHELALQRGGTNSGNIEVDGRMQIANGEELLNDQSGGNRGVIDVASGGVVQGALRNRGTINAAGDIIGQITNQNGGALNLTNRVTGSVINEQGGQLDARGQITGQLDNSGRANLTGDLSAGSIRNRGTGRLEVGEGQALTMTNGVLVNSAGTSAGPQAGLGLQGRLNGDLENSGRVDLGSTTPGQIATIAGDVVNDGHILVQADSHIAGNVTNNATIAAGQDGDLRLSVDGDFFNSQTGVLIGRTGAGNEITIEAGGQILQYGQVEGNVRFLGTVVNGGQIRYTTDIVLDNRLINAEPGRVEVRADVDANGFDTINRGDFLIAGNGNFHDSAQFDNSGHLQIDQGGQLQADQLVNSGANGRIDNSGQITTDIDNSAVLNSAGVIDGMVTNRATGQATLSGEVTGPIENHGEMRVSGDLQADQVINHISGHAVIATGATLSTAQPLDNRGRLDLAGVLGTDLRNRASGVVDITGGSLAGDIGNEGRVGGNGQILGRIANAQPGQVQLTGNQELSVDGGIDNEGLVQVSQNGRLGSDISNRQTGHILLQGNGRIEGAIGNEGLVSGNGRIDGDLSNGTAGRIQLGGQIAGRLTQQADGLFQTRTGATLTVDDFTNLANSEIVANSVLVTRNQADNESSLDIAGVMRGDLNNAPAGRITMTGGTLQGSLQNLGDIAGEGRLAGDVTNRQGGTFHMAGEVSGRLMNHGTMTLAGQDSLRVTDELRNQGSATLDGEFQGTIRNNAALNSTGQITGNVENSATGTAQMRGLVTGQLTNLGSASTTGDLHLGQLLNLSLLEVGAGHRLTSDKAVENRGDLVLSGILRSQIDNQGLLDIADTGVSDRLIRNLSGGVVQSSGRIAGGLHNDAGGRAALAGRALSPIVNDGRIETAGDLLAGNLQNRTGGMIEVRQGESLTIAEGEQLQNDGRAILAGRLDGALVNSASGQIRLQGGDLDGMTDNRGTITGSGTITGQVENRGTLLVGANDRLEVLGQFTNRTGTMDLSGQVQGDLHNMADGQALLRGGSVNGTLHNHGGQIVLEGGHLSSLVNDQGGAVTVQGSADLGNILNASQSTLSLLDASISGPIRNDADSTILSGTGRVAGNLHNDGLVSMEGEGDSDVLTVGGLSGQGRYLLDLDLIDMRADRIRVEGGAATGELHFDFNLRAQANLPGIGQPLTVLEVDRRYGSANNYTYTAQSLPAISERIVYSLQRNSSNDLVVYSQVNPAIGALLGNVALTHSMIGSVINRPSSPYVVGRAYDDPDRNCGIGSWGRAVGGHAKATGATDNGVSRAESSVKATYYGMQAGTDMACFNGAFDGWDMSLGGILGVSRGDTTQPNYGVDPTDATRISGVLASVTRTDFDQLYGGIYMTAAKDRWTLDVQYRLERTEFEIENEPMQGQGLGLTDTTLTSRGRTFSGALSYALPVGKSGWTVVPTAGFAWSKLKIDDLRFDDGFRLSFDSPQNKVAFLGSTLTRTFIQPAGDSALNIYATGTHYKDFSQSTRSVFSSDTSADFTAQNLNSDHLGAYSELSIGANYLKVLPGKGGRTRQLSAGARIDGRYGSRLDSVGVTGQLRYQF